MSKQCPNCKTVYRYGDVRKSMNKKNIICYHCKKEIAVSRKGFWILIPAVVLICAAFNVFELYVIASVSFTALVVTNIVAVTVGFLIAPHFVKFKKIKEPLIK